MPNCPGRMADAFLEFNDVFVEEMGVLVSGVKRELKTRQICAALIVGMNVSQLTLINCWNVVPTTKNMVDCRRKAV